MNRFVLRVPALLALTFLAGTLFAQGVGARLEITRRANNSAASEKALEVLSVSMQRMSRENVIAIILQNGSDAEGGQQRVRLQRAKDGRTRLTVLAPLKLQGIESIDNGDLQIVYWPDKKTIIQQGSLLKDIDDANDRVNLAGRNYLFSMETKGVIAGRKTVCITATPKHAELGNRKYYIDSKTYYPLKLETQEGDGIRTVFEVKSVQYPASLTASTFQFTPQRGTTTVKYTRPTDVRSNEAAKELIGFSPVVPTKLPYGFEVQDLQVKLDDTWKHVKFRITDGLIRATVYQWRPDGKDAPISSISGTALGEVNGLKILVASDMGPDFRSRMLEAFLRKGAREPGGRLSSVRVPNSFEFLRSTEPQEDFKALVSIHRLGISTGLTRKPLNA